MSEPWQAPPGQPGYGPPQNGPYGPQGGPPPKSGSHVVAIILVVVGVLVVFVGILAALAIAGTRRYLAAAKGAEAKNTLMAINRSVKAAYEHEVPSSPDDPTSASSHRLCGSAVPVPSSVPRGVKRQASSAEGTDFLTGSETEGWKCLRFDGQFLSYYQYDYRVGGNYKGPARGGPDPGPEGYEISAEGDLNGDGKTSLFTVVGSVDKGTHTIVSSDKIFIVDESE